MAKRARQIVARREPGAVLAHKPVIIALEEIEQGRVRVVSKPEMEGEAEKPSESLEAREETVVQVPETEEAQAVQEAEAVQEPEPVQEPEAVQETVAPQEAAATPAPPPKEEGPEVERPKT